MKVEERSAELKEVFHEMKKVSHKIIDELADLLAEHECAYEINEPRTEIIIKNTSLKKINKIIDDYTSSSSLLNEYINIILSVTQLDKVVVVRLKYA